MMFYCYINVSLILHYFNFSNVFMTSTRRNCVGWQQDVYIHIMYVSWHARANSANLNFTEELGFACHISQDQLRRVTFLKKNQGLLDLDVSILLRFLSRVIGSTSNGLKKFRKNYPRCGSDNLENPLSLRKPHEFWKGLIVWHDAWH